MPFTRSQPATRRHAGGHDGSKLWSGASRDEMDMRRLGKKPVLKRDLGFTSVMGFCCTVLLTWEATLLTYMQSFENGGPGGVVFGFLMVWLGTMSVFATVGELASMAPVAGGQYYWVAILAPESCRRLLSYITAWMTFIGWQALTASFGYLMGTLIQALVIFTQPTYNPKLWHGILMYWAVVLSAVMMNTLARQALGSFESALLVFHIFGFLAVLIPLVYLGPHDSSIYTTFLNEGGWPSMSLSFFVGLSGSMFTLIGADSAVHMCEEVKDAGVTVPRALLAGIFLNGLLGFGMILALVGCIGDIDAVFAAASTVQYPFLEVFLQATNSIAGSTVMASIIVFSGVCGTVAVVASTSRMTWSFARDHGLPFWKTLAKASCPGHLGAAVLIDVQLNEDSAIPAYSIALTACVSTLLSFVALGSAIAFNDLISLTVSALYLSYLICCSLLLWRRCTGKMRSPAELTRPMGPDHLAWGRWKIPGVLGIANNVLSCIYLSVLGFFSFWPPATPVESAASMNFAAVVFGAVVILSLIWYFVRARKTYQGPIIETEEISGVYSRAIIWDT